MTAIFDTIRRLPPARDVAGIFLDAGVKSFAVLAAAGVAVAGMRRRSAAARHLVCFLAVASLPLLPVLSWALPGWRVLPGWMELREPSRSATPSISSTPSTLSTPSRVAPAPRRFANPRPPAPAPTPETASPQPVPSPAVQIIAASEPPPARARMDGWRLGSLAWLAGVLVALTPAVLGVFSLRRLERAARRETAASWLDLLAQLLTRHGFKRRVVLLKAARRRMPMTWGVLRPKVLLPEESREWPPGRRGVVLLHELAHAKRCDYLTLMVTRLVCALYWFNPLVWLAARRMVAERERACDDIVLRHGAEPADYAEQVLEISAGLSPGWFAHCGGVAMARPSNLESRLRAILGANRNRAALTRAAVLSALLLLTAILVPVAMMKAAPGPGAAGGRKTAPVAANNIPYSAGFVPEKSEIALGEPLSVTFNLTNTSDRTIYLEVGRTDPRPPHGGGPNPFRFWATDAKGDIIPDPSLERTDSNWMDTPIGLGGEYLNPFSQIWGINAGTPIDPGSVYTERVLLRGGGIFKQPGEYTYTVNASREIHLYKDLISGASHQTNAMSATGFALFYPDVLSTNDSVSERFTDSFKLKVLPAANSQTPPAPANPQSDWGEAFDGFRVRLRLPANAVPGDTTPRLLVDIENKGPKRWAMTNQEAWELEVDGRWYVNNGLRSPSDSPFLSYGVELEVVPGPAWTGLPLVLNGGWRVPGPGELGRGGFITGSLWHYYPTNPPLVVSPGTHTVRVAVFGVKSATYIGKYAPDRVVSKPVEIEVTTNAPDPDWPWKGAQSTRMYGLPHWLARARKWRDLPGTPQLRTVEEAVSYVVKEDSVVNFKGEEFGGEPFGWTLPSGRKVEDGMIQGLFHAVFAPFGKQAIPALIDLLDNDADYARTGSYLYIQMITGRKDGRYNPGFSKADRQQSIQAWREWWEKNKNNPRLDYLPERVYDAADWDAARIPKPPETVLAELRNLLPED